MALVVLRLGDMDWDAEVEDGVTLSVVNDPVGIGRPMVVMLEILLRILNIALLFRQQKVGLIVSWQQ